MICYYSKSHNLLNKFLLKSAVFLFKIENIKEERILKLRKYTDKNKQNAINYADFVLSI
jgi:hypothetical protein